MSPRPLLFPHNQIAFLKRELLVKDDQIHALRDRVESLSEEGVWPLWITLIIDFCPKEEARHPSRLRAVASHMCVLPLPTPPPPLPGQFAHPLQALGQLRALRPVLMPLPSSRR